jgi:hypothetical protein
MRTLRPIAGLFFAAVGVLMLLIAVAAWIVGLHRDADGAFTARLAPVHASGYAIVVPDLAGAVQRHGAGRLIGLGDLRLSVASPDRVLLAIAPTVDVSRYLDGVARTELSGVGYATGSQPVWSGDIPGTAPAHGLPLIAPWLVVPSDHALGWSLAKDTPMSLVVMRADGQPGLTVTLTAGLSPPSWGLVLAGLLLVGGVVLTGGGVLLVWPVPRREVVLMVDPDHADEVAERLGPWWAPRQSYEDVEPPYDEEELQRGYVETAT